MKTYHARIAGLCPALDGIIVEVVEPEHPMVVVSNYVHSATVLKLAGKPVHPGGFTLPVSFLTPLQDVKEEDLALDNPFGLVVDHESWVSADAHLVATKYANAAHFNIRNTKNGRTLADQILWNNAATAAWECLQEMMARSSDPVAFLFELKEITNG